MVYCLIQPSTSGAVTNKDIVSALQQHYDPRTHKHYSPKKRQETMKRQDGGRQRRDKTEGGAVNAYMAVLKNLGADCNFRTLPTTTVAT